MKWSDENLGVLQNLEFVVVEIWRANPQMTDYTAQRAYEAAFHYYRAEMRGQTPKLPSLTGLDAETFNALKSMCEFRLGRAAEVDGEKLAAVPVENLVECLRELGKSVERHTKSGGRTGYVSFVSQYVR